MNTEMPALDDEALEVLADLRSGRTSALHDEHDGLDGILDALKAGRLVYDNGGRFFVTVRGELALRDANWRVPR